MYSRKKVSVQTRRYVRMMNVWSRKITCFLASPLEELGWEGEMLS